MMENNISIRLTTEEFDKVLQAIQVIEATLKPHLILLTPEQRRQLPKMSDKTTPFVELALRSAEKNPEFSPDSLDVAELKVDFDAVQTLNKLGKPLEKIQTQLSDTILLAGSEAYVAAVDYYNTVKQAAEITPKAREIYTELESKY